MTSGEATWQALAERTEPFFAALGKRCILWSRYDRMEIGKRIGQRQG